MSFFKVKFAGVQRMEKQIDNSILPLFQVPGTDGSDRCKFFLILFLKGNS